MNGVTFDEGGASLPLFLHVKERTPALAGGASVRTTPVCDKVRGCRRRSGAGCDHAVGVEVDAGLVAGGGHAQSNA